VRIAVVMPAWNEADGIEEFIRELHDQLKDWSPEFIVVDDCSTDGTKDVLRVLRETGFNVTCRTNPQNMGHGPSTLTALRMGLDTDADLIVALDGDGQFLGSDVASLVNIAASAMPHQPVIEGVRTDRDEPVYRRLISAATKLLVGLRSRSMPLDANTPFRVYTRDALSSLIDHIPTNSLIPNLHMSALVRERNLEIRMVPVTSRVRRGVSVTGSTWGKIGKLLPNRRLVKFCLRATSEWFNAVRTRSCRRR
jgi:glycosyltransferase involved in cell wall biosynthesis